MNHIHATRRVVLDQIRQQWGKYGPEQIRHIEGLSIPTWAPACGSWRTYCTSDSSKEAQTSGQGDVSGPQETDGGESASRRKQKKLKWKDVMEDRLEGSDILYSSKSADYDIWESLPKPFKDKIRPPSDLKNMRLEIDQLAEDILNEIEKGEENIEVPENQITEEDDSSFGGIDMSKINDEGCLEWKVALYLQPFAAVLPSHPMNRKVKLTVHLDKLQEQHSLTTEQIDHMILISGPRYNKEHHTLYMSCEQHARRIDNQQVLYKIVCDLIDEARSFLPSTSHSTVESEE